MVVARRWTCCLLLLLAAPAGAAGLAGQAGTFTYALELKGAFAGWLTAADPGGIGRTVSSDTFQAAGPVRARAIVVELTGQPSPAVAAWLSDWVAGRAGKMSGALLLVSEVSPVVHARLAFFNAQLTAVTLSRVDVAAGREHVTLRLELLPETTRLEFPAAGPPLTAPRPALAWSAANFSLAVDGLAPGPSTVRSFGPISCTSPPPTSAAGAASGKRPACALVEVAIPWLAADPWFAWADAALWNGHAVPATARLTLLAPDQRQPLLTVVLSGGLLMDFVPAFPKPGEGLQALVKAQVHFDLAAFQFGGEGGKDGLPQPAVPAPLLLPGRKG